MIFYCGSAISRILLYFHMLVCPSFSHKHDVWAFVNYMILQSHRPYNPQKPPWLGFCKPYAHQREVNETKTKFIGRFAVGLSGFLSVLIEELRSEIQSQTIPNIHPL